MRETEGQPERKASMSLATEGESVLDPQTCAFYRQALKAIQAAQVPFLVGGAYAFACYAGIVRHTKDFDIFVQQQHCERIFNVLHILGYHTELTHPHWLGKIFCGETHIDVIFASGNGVAAVDETWFTHAIEGNVLGMPVWLCAPEEMLWSKAFVMERERYDGADIAHLLHVSGEGLDWSRLLWRFGLHWRVLLSHLVLFGFIYPTERSRIPNWIMQELVNRLQSDMHSTPPTDRICQGTLLSRAQYLVDIERWGYQDARLVPEGRMTLEDIAHWTAAIAAESETDDAFKRW
jgi:hypothetical protein